MTTYKLVAFDLDGTLLNSQHEISSRTESMLRRLHEKGIHIVLATGRTMTVVRRLMKRLSILNGPSAISLSPENKTRWLFAPSNGGAVYDENYQCLSTQEIPPAMCKALYSVRKDDPDVNVNVFFSVTPEDRQIPGYTNVSDIEGDLATDQWACRRYDPREAAVQENGKFYQQVMPDLENTLRTTGIGEIFFLCYDGKKRSEITEEIKACVAAVEKQMGVSNTMHIAPSAVHCVDVVPVTMNKSAALTFIANHVGVPLKECVAFGDGMNDAAMLKAVGKGFVMGNANPSLKADFPEGEVIGCNDDDAVAITVEKIFGL